MRSSPLLSVIVIGIASLLYTPAITAQVLTDEQFSGSEVDTSVFTFDAGSTFFGRTQLNSTGLPGPFDAPSVENGSLRLRLQSFNSFAPGDVFLADEVRTRREFAPTEAVGFSFDTRARFVDDETNPLSPGVIGGLFLFGVDANFPNPNERDEIDFELLSNSPQDTISTNIFNDDGFNVSGDFMVQNIPGLDLTQFNDFRIESRVDSTRFFVNDQLIREELTNLAIEPQDFRLNINAQGPEFPQAFSSEIQPTANSADNEIFILEIDSLVITQLADTDTLLLADFTDDTNDEFTIEAFNSGTSTTDGFLVGLTESDNNFGGVGVAQGEGLLSEGVFLTEDTQFLVEATIGENNDNDLVLAIRENSNEFFSVVVSAEDLAEDGQAVVNLSDFFFNGDSVGFGLSDGILNDAIAEVSLQSPFGEGNAIDFTAQRISIFTVDPIIAIPEPSSAAFVLLGAMTAAFRRRRAG